MRYIVYDSPGGPLWTGVLDHPSGGCKRSIRERRILLVIFSGVFKHVASRRWMTQELADADGSEGWQDTMAEACHEDAGFGMRQSGAQQTR